MATSRRTFIQTSALIGAGFAAAPAIIKAARLFAGPAPVTADPRFTAPVIDPRTIPKFTDALPVPLPGSNGIWPVLTGPRHAIVVRLVSTQVLPQGNADFPALATPCWTYRAGGNYDHTYLGPIIVGTRNTPTRVTFDYSAIDPTRHLLKTGDAAKAGGATVVDTQVHGTHLGEPEVRFIAHKHGSVGISQESDGYAESWVTPNGKTGRTFNPRRPLPSPVGFEPGSDVAHARIVHLYPNAQGACTAWYHDHALGITRLNVYAGMAGGFLITDAVEADLIARGVLPRLGGHFDVPLVIQDRMFYPDGSLAYPDRPAANSAGCRPWPDGPSTLPEFFGDCIVVNGKTWPHLDVDPATYRLRIINGCNSRFLDLEMQTSPSSDLLMIATEGGFLPSAFSTRRLLMGPAERFDVLFDFAPFAGKTIMLVNTGSKPYPHGMSPGPEVDGVVMQFRVKPNMTIPTEIKTSLPQVLNAAATPLSKLKPGAPIRRVLLFEGMDEFGRLQPMLGQVTGTRGGGLMAMPLLWGGAVTESSRAGSVEIWEFYNPTMDAHPIHMHEILFSVLNRQPLAADDTAAAARCGRLPSPFPLTVQGEARPAEAYERAFKDTVIAYPGEVTRVVADFTGARPGRFAWHCHILEHEDHEMMRPYDVV